MKLINLTKGGNTIFSSSFFSVYNTTFQMLVNIFVYIVFIRLATKKDFYPIAPFYRNLEFHNSEVIFAAYNTNVYIHWTSHVKNSASKDQFFNQRAGKMTDVIIFVNMETRCHSCQMSTCHLPCGSCPWCDRNWQMPMMPAQISLQILFHVCSVFLNS